MHILDALFSQIRGNNTRETLTVFNLSRLAALWFAGVCSSLVLVRRRIRKEKILSGRKMFHAIAVVMFGLPMHFWRDDYGQILIPVAFATCLVLFCSIEYLRVSQRWSNITRLIFAWEKKKKRRLSQEGVVFMDSHWTSPGLLDNHWTGTKFRCSFKFGTFWNHVLHVATRRPDSASFNLDTQTKNRFMN